MWYTDGDIIIGRRGMKYVISYACVSDRGRARRINQDNFICRGVYMEPPDGGVAFPLTGKTEPSGRAVFGVFDGLGGEMCGEAASLIAAKNASKLTLGADAAADMIDFCKRTNDDICRFADEHGVASTGTTAAMLAFTDKCVTVCNIGDSRVYRLAGGELTQISTDHVINAAPGRKPPLSQNLGIPKTEMKIEPYAARGAYGDGDVYVICSDGLTDAASREDIAKAASTMSAADAAEALVKLALDAGGRDNITVIICKIERVRAFPFGRGGRASNKEV